MLGKRGRSERLDRVSGVKATLRDFIACGVAIAGIAAGSLLVVLFLVRPLSSSSFLQYHVVVDFFVFLALYGVLSALVVRAILRIRPIVAGDYDMDSPVFSRWKIVTILYRLGQKALLPFTPEFVRPSIARLFGARIGSDVAIGGTIDDPYLVSIGKGVVLGNHSLVAGSVIANGRIVLGEVRIGDHATIGVNAVVLAGTEIGERALLMGGSIVAAGTRIPAGETWRGNPARKWL